MAEVIKEENRDGVIVRVYDNGMEKGLDGRIIRGPTNALITSETASEYHRLRKEKKRAIVAAAANLAVSEVDTQLLDQFGDSAYVAAIAQSQTRKALNPKDPKSTEAARFVFSESGIGELSQEDGGPAGAAAGASPRILLLIAELTRRAESLDVIDGSEVP
jgi:hypothetical protein